MLPDALDEDVGNATSPFLNGTEQHSAATGHARRPSDPFSEAHAVCTPSKRRPPPVPMRLSAFGSSVNLSFEAGVLEEARVRTFRMSSSLKNPDLLEYAPLAQRLQD